MPRPIKPRTRVASLESPDDDAIELRSPVEFKDSAHLELFRSYLNLSGTTGKANQAESEAGENDSKWMSPLGTRQAIRTVVPGRVAYGSTLTPADSNILTGGGTDATAALNAFLSTASPMSPVELILDGPFLTTDSLILHPYSRVRGLPGGGVFAAAGHNKPIFRNAASADFFLVATQEYSLTVDVGRTLDSNIEIIGGTYNQNGANQADWANDGTVLTAVPYGIMITWAEDVLIQDVRILNSRQFNFCFWGVENLTCVRCVTDNTAYQGGFQDGFHFYGPALNSGLLNCSVIQNTDDAVAFMDKETSWPVGSGGSITNCFCDGLRIINGVACFRVHGDANPVNGLLVTNTLGDIQGGIHTRALITSGTFNNFSIIVFDVVNATLIDGDPPNQTAVTLFPF